MRTVSGLLSSICQPGQFVPEHGVPVPRQIEAAGRLETMHGSGLVVVLLLLDGVADAIVADDATLHLIADVSDLGLARARAGPG